MGIKYYLAFFGIVIVILSVRFYTFYSVIPEIHEGQGLLIKTVISNEPEVSGKTQRFSIMVKSHRISVTAHKYPMYHYGDSVEISGEIKVSQKDSRIFYNLSYPKIQKLPLKPNPFMAFSLLVRNRAVDIFNRVLSPTHAALLLGIVFGIKQDMPDEFLRILRDAGVIHVIAASGMNVSILAAALFLITGNLLKRRYALVVSAFGILLYVFIAGFEASIVRAAILAEITFTAGIVGRQKSSIYALFVTAVIMLFINPSWIFDIGFQLSFLATLGIIVLKPIFDKMPKRTMKFKSLRDDFNTTLSAQLAAVPVLISNFGSINLISIIVNVFVLWTIPILMIIGMVSIVMGLIFTQFGAFIAIFAVPLLTYFEIVVKWFDRFKMPVSLESSSWILWAGYYLVLIAVVVFLQEDKKPK